MTRNSSTDENGVTFQVRLGDYGSRSLRDRIAGARELMDKQSSSISTPALGQVVAQDTTI